MIISFIILFISLFLEAIVPNLIREFIPFFMIAALVIISTFKTEEKHTYIMIFLFGVAYDLLYTDLLIFHGFLFVLFFYLINLLLKQRSNFFLMIFSYYLFIFVYFFIMTFFTFLYTNINYLKLLNFVLKSLFINSIYFIFYYLIFIGVKCLIRNRSKKRSY